MSNKYWAAVALTGTLAIAGCSGGSDTPTTGTNTATYKGTLLAVSASEVTIANGSSAVTFDATNAKIVNDSETSLAPGNVVTITGKADGTTGTAQIVEYDSDVEGMVTAVSFDADNSMVVMGQTVIVDDMTIYSDGLTASTDIKVGEFVEVSGFFQDDGSILAKHIEGKSDENEIEIKGLIANLVIADADNATFDLSGCTIAVNAETKLEDLNSVEELVEGLMVEVKSTADTLDPNQTCSLTANKVEVEEIDDDENDSEDEVKGEVTGDVVDNSFTMMPKDGQDNQTVVITDTTKFENGVVGDIVIGAMLEVEGYFDATTGDLIAEEIELENEMEVPQIAKGKIKGAVEAVDSKSLTVMGQLITVTGMTMIVSDRPEVAPTMAAMAMDVMPTSPMLVDIIAGDLVAINFKKDDAGAMMATLIVIKKASEVIRSAVKGMVSSSDVAANTVTIEGVVVSVANVIPVLDVSTVVDGAKAEAAGTYDIDTMELVADEIAVKGSTTIPPGV
ncbi:MAG: DUF5666 domain-containing protein [Thiohalomonadales bacterium]